MINGTRYEISFLVQIVQKVLYWIANKYKRRISRQCKYIRNNVT